MTIDTPKEIEPNPTIAALEKAATPCAKLYGYLGGKREEGLRLYQSLDTDSYVDIPNEAVLFIEASPGECCCGETGSVCVLVRESDQLIEITRRRTRANKSVYTFRGPPAGGEGTLSTPRPGRPPLEVDTWSACRTRCEGPFANMARRILMLELEAAAPGVPPARAYALSAQAQQLELQAKNALTYCLSRCPAPPKSGWFEDPDTGELRWIEPYSRGVAYRDIVEKYLGSREK